MCKSSGNIGWKGALFYHTCFCLFNGPNLSITQGSVKNCSQILQYIFGNPSNKINLTIMFGDTQCVRCGILNNVKSQQTCDYLSLVLDFFPFPNRKYFQFNVSDKEQQTIKKCSIAKT